ncbi:MAG: succinate dehydrogenase cytochrome b subunit [Bacteroidales bacterium]|nr:succinate dehydrogenase cytochrome b subunit [Bacteroidales bacterium]
MFIFNSSIGKKFIQAVSGAFLILFLGLHVTINSFSIIDSFTGKFGAADGLFQAGCDFMALPVVTIMVPILALGFAVHILYGCWLTIKNIVARGGVKRYEVSSKAAADSWSAKNMCILGIIIIGFVCFHLFHFWAKMQLQMFIGGPESNPYDLLVLTFGAWWRLALYLLWFLAVWFHLTHGFWSMFQTVGWDGKTWFNRVKVIGVIVATLICVMFAAVGINAFLQANFLI